MWMWYSVVMRFHIIISMYSLVLNPDQMQFVCVFLCHNFLTILCLRTEQTRASITCLMS
uniref:Uncharacterized protein n=1 Tax=Arundo donax TaxID=35708 RepID=A0A0A9GK39_ARUDO